MKEKESKRPRIAFITRTKIPKRKEYEDVHPRHRIAFLGRAPKKDKIRKTEPKEAE